MASVFGEVIIVIEAPNGDVRELSVGKSALVIGRDESADIRVNDKKVSRRHVAFRVDGAQLLVEDLGSVNGVKLNGRRVDGKEDFNEGDVVNFGGYQVTVSPTSQSAAAEISTPIKKGPGEVESISEELYAFLEPRMAESSEASSHEFDAALDSHDIEPALIGLDSPVKDERFILQVGENIIGRLDDCDIPILDASISRQHARISLQAGSTLVQDLNSSNGTFIDEEAVQSGDLAHGDILRVGSIKFSVQLPEVYVRESRTRRKAGGASNASTLSAFGPFSLIASLLMLAILVGSVSWFVRADKPFTVLASLLDFDEKSPMPDEFEAPPSKENTPSHSNEAAKAKLVAKRDQQNKPELLVVGGEENLDRRAKGPAPTQTSTSPFGGRDADGWPLNLPEVNPDFDFDAFVYEMLAKAEQQLAQQEFDRARGTLRLLLSKDPINAAAKRMIVGIENQAQASAKLRSAEALALRGQKARAIAIYKTLTSHLVFGALATQKVDALKKDVITQELAEARSESKKRKTWSKAHARLLLVLELDPKHKQARERIAAMEKKMRSNKIRFSAYRVGKDATTASVDKDRNEVSDSLLAGHLSDRSLMPIAKFYLRGDFERAQRSALRLVKKKSKKQRRAAARKMLRALDRVKAKYARVRTALGNDPSEAWFYFSEFQKEERAILPAQLKSFWRTELEISIAEAYAAQGEMMFVQERYEEAFTKWDAGRKLRPENAKIEAGLAKLEVMAQKIRIEAELLLQQTKPGACDRFREITKMTASNTDIYKIGRAMALRVCQ